MKKTLGDALYPKAKFKKRILMSMVANDTGMMETIGRISMKSSGHSKIKFLAAD